MKYSLYCFVLLIVFIFQSVSGEEFSITKDRDIKTININDNSFHNKLKAGVAIGYPLGITAGYRFSNFFELNGMIGTDYNHLTAGVNGLFTLFNLGISGEKFPVLFGPALYTHFYHHENGERQTGYTSADLLGVVRIEYSFDAAPVNLFFEAGLGFQIIKFADDAGCMAIGIRYIY